MNLTHGAQLRAARALLKLEKAELSQLSCVSSATIRKMEEPDGPFEARTSTARALEGVLVARGIIFLNGDEPGARLRLMPRSEVA